MKVVKEEVAASCRDLIGIAGGVVVDIVPMALGPPILLGWIELRGDLRMALEGQHTGERFAVGYPAVPAVVDGGLEDLDDLRRQEAGRPDRIGEHVHVGAG